MKHGGLQSICCRTHRRSRDRHVRIFVFLALVFTAAGCTHTTFVAREPSSKSITVTTFNEIMLEKECTIFLRNRTVWQASHTRVASDSLIWRKSNQPAEESTHLSDVVRVEFEDGTRALTDGLLWGGAGSVALFIFLPRRSGDIIFGPPYAEAATLFALSVGGAVVAGGTRRFVFTVY